MKRMNFPRRKQRRRDAAQWRQEQYDKLTTEQKLAQIKSRRGMSYKERSRLEG